jgi:hypothetical protein
VALVGQEHAKTMLSQLPMAYPKMQQQASTGSQATHCTAHAHASIKIEVPLVGAPGRCHTTAVEGCRCHTTAVAEHTTEARSSRSLHTCTRAHGHTMRAGGATMGVRLCESGEMRRNRVLWVSPFRQHHTTIDAE